MKIFCNVATVLVLSLLTFGCATTHKPPQFDSPEAVSRFLEQRWPVAYLLEYCRPEIRMFPWDFGFVLHHRANCEGNIHNQATNSFDRVEWIGCVTNGFLTDFCLIAKKGDCSWMAEYYDLEFDKTGKSEVLRRLTLDDVIMLRLQSTICRALCFQLDFHKEMTEETNATTKAVQTYDYYRELLIESVPVRSTTLLRDSAGGKPRQYIEIMDNPRRDTLTVDLDAEGKPAAFYLNSKRDKTLDTYYREYIENYEQFLRHLDESEKQDKEKP